MRTRAILMLAACAAVALGGARAGAQTLVDPRLAPGQAKAEGDALLAQARAADLFDNLTAEDGREITRTGRSRCFASSWLTNGQAPWFSGSSWTQTSSAPGYFASTACSSSIGSG